MTKKTQTAPKPPALRLLRRHGGTVVVVIPPAVLTAAGLKVGDHVWVSSPRPESVVVRRATVK